MNNALNKQQDNEETKTTEDISLTDSHGDIWYS